MGNGMGSLFVGNSGLHAAQDAINTVANNLANVNTNGYVRQQVVFRDTNYNSLAYTRDMNKKLLGLGTSIGDIVHARDIFLDNAYRMEAGRQSYYSTCFEAIDEVQNYFQELEGSAFRDILSGDNSLWQSFQEYVKDPSDTVNQNLVIQRASLFVSRAQAVNTGMVNFQQNINTQISDDIDDINELAQKIYDCNVRIQAIETGGREKAMNERDARDYAIDQLSKYGSVYCTENGNGVISLKFEGELMVDDNHCYEIGKKTDRATGFITPYWPQLSNEAAGRYVEVLDFTRDICTEYNTDIGSLKALVQSRGTTISNYVDMSLDPDMYDATTGLSVMQNTQAEFDNLIHGLAAQINDLFAPNTTVESITVNNGDGTTTTYHNAVVLDVENCPLGADGELPPQELFTRTGTPRYTEIRGRDQDGNWKTFYLYNPEDNNDSVKKTINGKQYDCYDLSDTTTAMYVTTTDAAGNTSAKRPYMPWNKEGNEKYIETYIGANKYYILNPDYTYDVARQYTVSNLNVNPELKKQVTKIPYLNQKGDVDYALAKQLTSIWEADTLTINPRYTTPFSYNNYYQEMIGEIAVIGNMYDTTSDSLSDTVESIETQRNSVIKVSSDEELTKMIKYQNAYNASSRYIQTVSDMMEALINGL